MFSRHFCKSHWGFVMSVQTQASNNQSSTQSERHSSQSHMPKKNEVFDFDLQEMQTALKGKKTRLPRIQTVEDMDKWLE